VTELRFEPRGGGLNLVVKIPLPSRRVLNLIGDWVFPVVLGGILVARCVVIDENRVLWADEILSWYPANASFRRMLSSTADTINGAPPLYFILAWFWTALFGKSGLALRLLSTFGSFLSIGLMSIVLRRAYGRLAAGAAWLVAIADNEFLAASSFARFHTIVAAEVALAILLYQRIVAEPRPSKRLLLGNACVHAAIVLTYYLGLLYSGAILGSFLVSGLVLRKNPLRGALSVVLGWLAFIPWIPIFIRHQSLAKPSIWIPVPSLNSLKGYYETIETYLSGQVTPVVLFALTAFLAITLLAAFTEKTSAVVAVRRTIRPRELPLLIVAFSILLVPTAIYLLSVRPGGTSLFLTRYFVPCIVAATILFAHVASRAIELCFLIPMSFFRSAILTLLIGLLSLKLMLTGIDQVQSVSQTAIGRQIPTSDFPVPHPPGEPVVVGFIHEFLNVVYFTNDPKRYVFIVDLEAGLLEGPGGVANHKILAAMGRNFPEFAGVKSSADFLASADRFWIKPDGMQWYAMRVANNPSFVTEPEGGLLHVHRAK
jgi:uncharacterized membrane protein